MERLLLVLIDNHQPVDAVRNFYDICQDPPYLHRVFLIPPLSTRQLLILVEGVDSPVLNIKITITEQTFLYCGFSLAGCIVVHFLVWKG